MGKRGPASFACTAVRGFGVVFDGGGFVMSNQELLEFAAKAAGIQIVGPVEKFIAQPNKEHIGGFIVRNSKGGDSCWNPLGDDGDALRLAVKLGMRVQEAYVWLDGCGGYGEGKKSKEYEPLAATRKAIVRAAADAGRRL